MVLPVVQASLCQISPDKPVLWTAGRRFKTHVGLLRAFRRFHRILAGGAFQTMDILIRGTRGSVAACLRRLVIMIALAAIALSPAPGQSSVPPLPALPLTFTFSNCDSGVTYQATITDWLRDASGNVDPLAARKVVQPTTTTYSYLFWGSFSMTVRSLV